MIGWYLEQKAQWSRDRLKKSQPPREKLPTNAMRDAESLWSWMAANLIYTGDGPRISWSAPLGRWIGVGFPDLYTHPEVLVAAALWDYADRVECDCDDYAILAYVALKKMEQEGRSLPVFGPSIMNLMAGSIQWQLTPPFAFWPSHVVCTFWRWDPNQLRWRLGTIDTNGLNWHDGYDQAIAYFSGLYKTTCTPFYISYPFEGV